MIGFFKHICWMAVFCWYCWLWTGKTLQIHLLTDISLCWTWRLFTRLIWWLHIHTGTGRARSEYLLSSISLLLRTNKSMAYLHIHLPSVLWRCWLGCRKGIRPVKKNEWWGDGMVICLEQGADLHMAQLMSLPLTVSCFIQIHIGFAFLVLAHPGSPGQRAVKRVCVCFWRCWLGDRKGIRPVKNWLVGCWHGYLSGARCRLAYGPADATATHCHLLQ